MTIDLLMPVMDGFETIEHVRERWPDLPIVVFSAAQQKSDEVKRTCVAREASYYLAKPETMPDFPAATRSVFPRQAAAAVSSQ